MSQNIEPPQTPYNWTCQWFLMCTNPATKTQPHPILGDVPICDRCAEKVAQAS